MPPAHERSPSGHSASETADGGSSSSRRSGSSSGRAAAFGSPSGSGSPDDASASASVVPLVVAPVLARMLGVHQDKQVQKAIAQLKLAFDNLEKQRPALSRDLVSQMFELVVCSNDPNVTSLMPPSVAALAAMPEPSSGVSVKPPPPGWPPHLAPPRGMPPPRPTSARPAGPPGGTPPRSSGGGGGAVPLS